MEPYDIREPAGFNSSVLMLCSVKNELITVDASLANAVLFFLFFSLVARSGEEQ